MHALGRTPALTLLIFIYNFVSESSCIDKNQSTQNSLPPVTEVYTTVSVQMGTKALLCCLSIPLTKAILITWIIIPRSQPFCMISYKVETKESYENCLGRNITWASTPDHIPDLQISAVALQHEGNYLCEITTPEGNFHKVYDLQVLVPPEVTYFLGENRTAVCEAMAGKPAAQISWSPDGDCVTKSESHSNGTVTVKSTCQWEQNNVFAVSCLVSHLTGNRTLFIELNQVYTIVSVQMGTKARLCCRSIPLTKAVLITWIIKPRGQPSCIMAYKVETKETNETCLGRNITWASTPDHIPDLQISAVALQHEGNYLCEITTPEGNFHKVYDLQVLVPPEVTYFLGENRTAVCEAMAGKPAAQISWSPDGDCVTKSESHSNGTVTVRSTCHWEQNNVSAVSCIVSHSTGNQSLSIELSRGTTSTTPSLLTILYVKMVLLGIILLKVGFAFFQKRNVTRT